MKESLDLDILPEEMQKYARMRTYIETDNLDNFRRKLLFALPKTPLKMIQPEGNNNDEIPPLFRRLHTYMGRQEEEIEEGLELYDINGA